MPGIVTVSLWYTVTIFMDSVTIFNSPNCLSSISGTLIFPNDRLTFLIKAVSLQHDC